MRVLNVHTGQFEDIDPLYDIYAILSHTWDEEEQTYQDVVAIQRSYDKHGRSVPSPASRHSESTTQAPDHHDALFSPVSSPTDTPPSRSHSTPSQDGPEAPSIWDDERWSWKVWDACARAREEGYDYLWVDSSCIDKSSSAELSEAINSMYKWYACATVCYAFLADVPSWLDRKDHEEDGSDFHKSRWFRRGWTLQELIAPFNVVFFSKDWKVIGSKRELAGIIEEITGVSGEALLHERSLDEFSVAERLSWASRRETTRVEDQAYSLLGIFDINMPTLYGEGERAFRRLQEEILQRIPDQSIFAWGDVYLGPNILREPAAPAQEELRSFQCKTYDTYMGTSLLAPRPAEFMTCGSIKMTSHEEVSLVRGLAHLPAIEYTPTPHGIRTRLPVIPLSPFLPENTRYGGDSPLYWYLVILGCEHKDVKDHPGHLLGRICYITASKSVIKTLYCGFVAISPEPEHYYRHPDLFPLSSAFIERYRSQIVLEAVYISHHHRADWVAQAARYRPHEKIVLLLSEGTLNALRAQGYTAELRRGCDGGDEDDGDPTTHRLTLSNDEHTISITVEHTLGRDGKRLAIKARAQVLGKEGGRGGNLKPVGWNGSWPWWWVLGDRTISLIAPRPKTINVTLGFKLARTSHYYLLVTTSVPDIQKEEGLDNLDVAANGDGHSGEVDSMDMDMTD